MWFYLLKLKCLRRCQVCDGHQEPVIVLAHDSVSFTVWRLTELSNIIRFVYYLFHLLLLTSCLLPLTSYLLPLASYLLPLASYLLPLASYRMSEFTLFSKPHFGFWTLIRKSNTHETHLIRFFLNKSTLILEWNSNN
jgi:hypothetical protein